MIDSRPRKHFAQHWLRSEQALNAIVSAAELKSSDRVLEIGPGTGVLTHRLLERATVVAVEIDRYLCKKLVKSFGNREKFLLLQGDILELDLDNNLKSFPQFQNPNKVVANIPYNITGPIIERLLGTISQPNQNNYDSIVLLIQKEVAERLIAKPCSKAFGALTVRVQYLAKCELIYEVPAKAFYPTPKVDSAIIRLMPQKIDNPANNPRNLETLVKVGFAQKRKMLRNNLKSLIEPEQLSEILDKLGINTQARGEELSISDWINLSNNFILK